jgi:hypothetical protein
MLDFGLLRLEMRLAKVAPNATVFYDWDDDAIKVVLVGGLGSTKEMCLDFIEEVKSNAGYQDGALWPTLGHSLFSGLFTHMGYFKGEEDKRLARLKNLDKKFQAVCFSSDTNARYAAKLMGKEVSVTALD